MNWKVRREREGKVQRRKLTLTEHFIPLYTSLCINEIWLLSHMHSVFIQPLIMFGSFRQSANCVDTYTKKQYTFTCLLLPTQTLLRMHTLRVQLSSSIASYFQRRIYLPRHPSQRCTFVLLLNLICFSSRHSQFMYWATYSLFSCLLYSLVFLFKETKRFWLRVHVRNSWVPLATVAR